MTLLAVLTQAASGRGHAHRCGTRRRSSAASTPATPTTVPTSSTIPVPAASPASPASSPAPDPGPAPVPLPADVLDPAVPDPLLPPQVPPAAEGAGAPPAAARTATHTCKEPELSAKANCRAKRPFGDGPVDEDAKRCEFCTRKECKANFRRAERHERDDEHAPGCATAAEHVRQLACIAKEKDRRAQEKAAKAGTTARNEAERERKRDAAEAARAAKTKAKELFGEQRGLKCWLLTFTVSDGHAPTSRLDAVADHLDEHEHVHERHVVCDLGRRQKQLRCHAVVLAKTSANQAEFEKHFTTLLGSENLTATLPQSELHAEELQRGRALVCRLTRRAVPEARLQAFLRQQNSHLRSPSSASCSSTAEWRSEATTALRVTDARAQPHLVDNHLSHRVSQREVVQSLTTPSANGIKLANCSLGTAKDIRGRRAADPDSPFEVVDRHSELESVAQENHHAAAARRQRRPDADRKLDLVPVQLHEVMSMAAMKDRCRKAERRHVHLRNEDGGLTTSQDVQHALDVAAKRCGDSPPRHDARQNTRPARPLRPSPAIVRQRRRRT